VRVLRLVPWLSLGVLGCLPSGSVPLEDLFGDKGRPLASAGNAAPATAPSGEVEEAPAEAEETHRWAGRWVTGPPEPRPDCVEALKAAGVKFGEAKIPVRTIKNSDRVCGAEQVVVYKGSPAGIRYEPAPVLTCTMAISLARFDGLVQAEATRALGTRVTRIRHLGTYACRGMAKFPGWPSEHSYANAIDVSTFVLKNGREISVARHFEATEDAPKKKEADFLRALATRSFEEDVFSSVLTPYFNAQHRDHFHLDLARYRINGTRVRERFFPQL